jgi:flavin reductase (DIM6/NTAB) family NADH-FMN oxidoreductase RutF
MSADMLALFRRISVGVYIVGVAHGAERDAFTAAALMQASYDPLLLALAINPQHASYRLLRDSGTFAVSVLGRDQMQLARRFGGVVQDGTDKMTSVSWRLGERGAPILEGALAFFDCTVQTDNVAGDHRLVLGLVTDGAILTHDGSPLLYADTANMDGSAVLFPASFNASPRS